MTATGMWNSPWFDQPAKRGNVNTGGASTEPSIAYGACNMGQKVAAAPPIIQSRSSADSQGRAVLPS